MTIKKLCILTFILFIITLIAYAFLRYYEINVLAEIYENIPIVVLSCLFYLFIISFDRSFSFNSIKNNFIGKCIVSISLCSYGMYFSHFLVLKFLQKLDIHSNKLFPIMVIAMIFLSWLLPYLISKIPYLKRFSGVG